MNAGNGPGYHRPLDRWQCTRSRADGGPCATGAGADGSCPHGSCSPSRSQRSVRRYLHVGVFLTTLFVLGMWLSGDWREQLIEPGQLTPAHRQYEGQCKRCHDGVNLDLFGWIAELNTEGHPSFHNKPCLDCHTRGSAPNQAHSRAEQPAGAPHPANYDGQDVACAWCHREHQGDAVPLAIVGDAICLACHSPDYQGFPQGHAPFSKHYPAERESNIAFGHALHFDSVFTKPAFEDRAPPRDACDSCHRLSADGRIRLPSYAEGCADCHEEGVFADNAAEVGLAVLYLPMLDGASLVEAGLPSGEWPTGTPGALAPMLQLLLKGDARDARLLAEVGGIDLSDLTDATAEELAAVSALVWTIKQLMADLRDRGQVLLKERLEHVSGATLEREQLAALAGGLPRAQLITLSEAWFGQLDAELEAHAQGLPLPRLENPESPQQSAAVPASAQGDGEGTQLLPGVGDLLLGGGDLLPGSGDLLPSDGGLLPGSDAPVPDPFMADAEALRTVREQSAQWVVGGGWYQHSGGLFYRPRGHADPFMRAWLDLLATLPTGLALREEWDHPKSPGNCALCHPASEGGVRRWQGGEVDTAVLNRFDHRPHAPAVLGLTCDSCHKVLPKRGAAGGGYEFEPLGAEACAECHRPDGSGDSCRHCHRYHDHTPLSRD